MRKLLITTCLSLGLTPAFADDAALLIGNERYENFDRVVQGAMPGQQGREMDRAGFKVFAGVNLIGGDANGLFDKFRAEAKDADRLVVALSGKFVTDGTRTWFIATNKNTPDLIRIGSRTLSIETVLLYLAETPGQSILILSPAALDEVTYDGPLRAGIGKLAIPHGVTVIQGRSAAAAKLLRDTISKRGGDVISDVRRSRGLRARGYQPETLVMTGPGRNAPEQPAGPTANEQDAWRMAQSRDTAQSYSTYLDRYPRGFFEREARRKLEEIRAEPNRAARLAEEALELPVDAQRGIQRDLNVLDFDTGGIDGIFGPSTRRAITNWQQQRGYAQTSYLNADLINRLDAQAARRVAELEAEAARQRAQQDRRDRAFWEETGAARSEAGYRAYLDRFPDGLYAESATEQLELIERRKRDQARAAERDAWDTARARNTVAAYRTYLERYPSGNFADNANTRMRALQQNTNNAQVREQAIEDERRLGLDAITIRLVEAQLKTLGLNPGRVDGRIDNSTRRAIRRYQRDRSLDRTGYLNRATVSRLLTDALR